MSTPYRYPGPRPFEEDDHTVFFGRDVDIRRLIEQLDIEPLLLLYGKSGLGKSSLLNAGVLPILGADRGWQPFKIRFEAWQESDKINTAPLDRVYAALDMGHPLLDKLRNGEEKSLWYLLKSRQFHNEEFTGGLFLFDQFEELFTYPDNMVQAFAAQLSESLYFTIPDSYRLRLENVLEAEPDSISDKELKLLHQPFELRVIMAIRSDRYSMLDRIKNYLPTLYDNTMELAPLSKSQAEEAILNPAYKIGDFESPVFDFTDEALDKLIAFLSQGKERNIESFQLQILCEYIERELVVREGSCLIEPQDLADPEQILERYYMRQIEKIDDAKERLAVRRLVEDGLVLESEERRLTLYEGQIERIYGVTKEQLNRLVDSHLIRAEPSLRGGYTYELSHDTIVVPVLKAKAIRTQLESADAERKAAAVQAVLLEKARKETVRSRRIAVLMGLLAFLAILASTFAYWSYLAAESEKEKAVLSQEVAKIAQQKAETALATKLRLESEQTLREVNTLLEANQVELALAILEAGIANDSTNTELKSLYYKIQRE